MRLCGFARDNVISLTLPHPSNRLRRLSALSLQGREKRRGCGFPPPSREGGPKGRPPRFPFPVEREAAEGPEGVYERQEDMDLTAEPQRARRGRKPGEHAAPASVQVLDRALKLLAIVAERDGATLSEVADAAGMAPSTTHRLLTSLAAHGMLAAEPDTGSWTIGVKAFEIGSAFLRSRKLGAIGRPLLKRLMEASGETANIAVEDGGDVVFIAQHESHAPMRAFFRPGRRGPLHASGVGKAILSAWPEREIRARLDGRKLERFTDRTLTTPPKLVADVAAARQRGWSLDDGEHTVGMRCVAAPVFNEYGEPVGGISVSGPAVRVTDDRLAALGRLVCGAAEALTAAIGGRRPEAP